MAFRNVILAAIATFAMAGLARADDHLFQALQHGLTADSQPFQVNPAGHSGELAPGQGSPFAGSDMQTPATDTEAANDHAQVKPRQAK